MSESVIEVPVEEKKEAPVAKASPAQDLRDIQNLLVGGIFPGNMAPMVVKSYTLLDNMAKQIEEASVAAPK